jgi:hypothetical protein
MLHGQRGALSWRGLRTLLTCLCATARWVGVWVKLLPCGFLRFCISCCVLPTVLRVDDMWLYRVLLQSSLHKQTQHITFLP